jgi:hypothetical protein
MYVPMYVGYVCMYVYVCVCMYVPMYVGYVCMYVGYVCVCMYMYVWYIYINVSGDEILRSMQGKVSKKFWEELIRLPFHYLTML